MTTEVVLPSGRFAEVRSVTVADMIKATQVAPGLSTMMVLASLTTRIDGINVSLDDWLIMEYAEVLPIVAQLNRQLENAYKTKEGVS